MLTALRYVTLIILVLMCIAGALIWSNAGLHVLRIGSWRTIIGMD
jgi:hypothetical protein